MKCCIDIYIPNTVPISIVPLPLVMLRPEGAFDCKMFGLFFFSTFLYTGVLKMWF